MKARWLAALAVPALWYGTRHLGPPARDAWSMIVIDADGAAMVARLSVTNTSLLDQQLHTRVTLLPPGYSPLQHHAMRGPTALGDFGVAQEPDALLHAGDGWELRVGGEGLGARITLSDADAACPPRVGAARGYVQPDGDTRAGRLVDGRGVVSRTHSTWDERGVALYVLGPGFAAGVDPIATCPAWVRAGDATWSGPAPEVVPEAGRPVDLGPYTLTVRSLGELAIEEPLGHLLGPERLLGSLLHMAPDRVTYRRVQVDVEGPGLAGQRAGVVIVRGS